MTSDGATRAAPLISDCEQERPRCRASLGNGGHVDVAFGDTAISAPIDAGGLAAFAGGVLGVFVASEAEASALADRINSRASAQNSDADQTGLIDDLFPIVFLVGALSVVATFLWPTARNARRYGASFEHPADLRRAGERTDPTGGSANGGGIWPSP